MDYRHLNLQTVEDRYPLPNMADLAACLAGCTIFSKLDLKKGYLQVPVAAGDVPKTVISNGTAAHRRHLSQVFEILEKSSLIVNAEKCVFGRPTIDFVGHTISAAGSSPLPSRVSAIADFPRPSNVRQLQAFSASSIFTGNSFRQLPGLFCLSLARYAAALARTNLYFGPPRWRPLSQWPGRLFPHPRFWSTRLTAPSFPW